MDLSYSSISTFKNCRRKFKFSSLDCLKPKKEDTGTSVGSVIHKAFHKFFLGTSIQDCASFICTEFDNAIASAQNPWDSEDLLIGKYTALGMWNFYPFQQCNFKTVPEPKFRIRIPGFKNVYLIGYLDGLFRDVSTKTLVREVKTTGLSMQQIKDRMSTAAQGDSYVWAMEKILGERIHGAWYDVIRKPLLKKGKTENAQGFAERIYKAYEDAKGEEAEKLYSTFPVWKTEVRLKQFEEDLIKDVREIVRAIKKGYLQRNTDSCQMYNRECPFKKICFVEGEPDSDMVESFYTKKEAKPDGPDTLVKGCKNPLAKL